PEQSAASTRARSTWYPGRAMAGRAAPAPSKAPLVIRNRRRSGPVMVSLARLMDASVPAGGNAGRLLPGGRWFCGFRRRGLALACRRPLFRIGGVLALIGETRQIAEVVHREQGLDGLIAGGAVAAFGGRIGFDGQFLVVLLRDQ